MTKYFRISYKMTQKRRIVENVEFLFVVKSIEVVNMYLIPLL